MTPEELIDHMEHLVRRAEGQALPYSTLIGEIRRMREHPEVVPTLPVALEDKNSVIATPQPPLIPKGLPPLVSIISPVMESRLTQIMETMIPSVQAQTYPNIEHILVSDGQSRMIEGAIAHLKKPRFTIHFHQLGHNWHNISGRQSWGCEPRVAGGYLARGAYVGYLDDDNAYYPDHVSALVDLLEETESDFVHSQLTADGQVYGRHPVEYGQIDTSTVLHRIELLHSSNWRADGYGNDGRLFLRWNGLGAASAFLHRVTVRYKVAAT